MGGGALPRNVLQENPADAIGGLEVQWKSWIKCQHSKVMRQRLQKLNSAAGARGVA